MKTEIEKQKWDFLTHTEKDKLLAALKDYMTTHDQLMHALEGWLRVELKSQEKDHHLGLPEK